MHRCVLSLPLLFILAAAQVRAQELEPRAYSPNPVGANYVLAGYVHSSGGVLFDPSLPFSDVEAKLHALAVSYGRTFDLLGRSALVGAVLPYVWGDVSGNVGEDRREASRSGAGDMRMRLSVNLLGGPALTPGEFAARRPGTTLGASLSVVIPTGQYDADRLVNIGSNRWAFKPEVGISQPLGRWQLEAYAGVWLFTTNSSFYGGQRREQDPLTSLQAHVSYTFRQRLWLAANATWYRGGRTSLDGVAKADLQENTRFGLTLSLPVSARQSLKLTWNDGASTRIGGDFTTWGVAWQLLWFD